MSETTQNYFPLVRDIQIRTSAGELVSLPFQKEEYGDWFYVGTFKHKDIQADCNCRMLIAMLLARAGRETFRHAMTYANTGGPFQSFLIVTNRDPNALAVAQDGMELHNAGEHLSDELYWEEVDVHLQRMWAEMPMPERIDAVKRTNTPHHVVLETNVVEDDHHELWTYLYQDMGL